MPSIRRAAELAATNPHLLVLALGFVVVVMAIAKWATSNRIPSVKFSFLGLDNITRYAENPVKFLTQARLKNGEVFKVNMIFSTTFWLYSPQLNKEYLETKDDIWSLGDGMGKFLNKIVGADYWQHFKTFIASLSRGTLRGEMLSHFRSLAEEETEKAIHSWGERDSIELFESVSELVHRIIVQCLMGPDFYENHIDELFTLLHVMEDNVGSVWNFVLPEWMPHPAARKLWAARDRMKVIVQERIDERNANPARWEDAKDYISYTLRDPMTRHLESYYAAHHTLLMFAAHTSTVSLIAWTVLELLKSPSRIPKLKEHVLESDNTDNAYLSALLKETGRHYSAIADVRLARRSKPLSTPFRQAPHPTTYQKLLTSKLFGSKPEPPQIPADSIVSISPYLTHHDPQLWTLPESWCPERWLEEPQLAQRLNTKTSVGYMPFGAGSHRCPGEKMALMIAQTVVGMLSKRAEIDFADGEKTKDNKFDNLDFSKVGSPWLVGDVRVKVKECL